jgi:hypothetical protein
MIHKCDVPQPPLGHLIRWKCICGQSWVRVAAETKKLFVPEQGSFPGM